MSDATQRLDTRLVHAGEHEASGPGRPTALPIYASATFVYDSAAALDAAFDHTDTQYVYGRYGNPTTAGLERAVADIEEAHGALATASGMAALHMALLAAATPRGATTAQPRHILASRDLYGTTYTLLRDVFAAQGAEVSFVDPTDLAALEQALGERRPDVLLLESMSNPLLRVADLAAISGLARAAGTRTVVDATMTTPVLHRPLRAGIDIVVHSATKYLSGHGDVIGGIVATRAALTLDNARRYARLLGVTMAPFEARLVSRGMKTLALRLRQQSANAMAVASWLATHPRVARVWYPGLAEHPDHAVATRDLGGLYGGMVSFEVADAGREAIFAIIDRLALILPATSLGDIYTLVSYPAIASHRDVPAEQRHAMGIGDGVLRLSIGIEDVSDIIADLAGALAT